MKLKFENYQGITGDFFENYITLGGITFYLLIATDKICDHNGNVINSYYIIDIDEKQIRNRKIKNKTQALRRVKQEIIHRYQQVISDVEKITIE